MSMKCLTGSVLFAVYHHRMKLKCVNENYSSALNSQRSEGAIEMQYICPLIMSQLYSFTKYMNAFHGFFSTLSVTVPWWLASLTKGKVMFAPFCLFCITLDARLTLLDLLVIWRFMGF